VRVDEAANGEMRGGAEGRISPDGDGPEVWVIPTDEEILIARDTFRVVEGKEARF
jgi:acetate kinase